MTMNEKLIEIQKEVNSVFNLLQMINAPMTENNIAILNGSLGSLKFINNIIDELLKEDQDGNTDAE